MGGGGCGESEDAGPRGIYPGPDATRRGSRAVNEQRSTEPYARRGTATVPRQPQTRTTIGHAPHRWLRYL